ncbi:MAG: hypothetical protein CEE43_17420 [Promethearchaeota archaeon Loki_b32]|nr:MAG: hypothetical protein CEE43_17420 [Candidatus Lokiarchaeota archaeon Loki_b32]
MRIIRIMDGFVTNSSSDSATIIIALRKGRDLVEAMKKIGVPSDLPENFYNFTDNLEYIEDYEIEIDHLTDEYDILINDILTMDSDDFYEIPYEELEALRWMAYTLEEKSGKDLIFLYFNESCMY